MPLIQSIDFHYIETIESKEGFQKCEEWPDHSPCGEDADILVSIETCDDAYLGQFCIICFLQYLHETYGY